MVVDRVQQRLAPEGQDALRQVLLGFAAVCVGGFNFLGPTFIKPSWKTRTDLR